MRYSADKENSKRLLDVSASEDNYGTADTQMVVIAIPPEGTVTTANLIPDVFNIILSFFSWEERLQLAIIFKYYNQEKALPALLNYSVDLPSLLPEKVKISLSHFEEWRILFAKNPLHNLLVVDSKKDIPGAVVSVEMSTALFHAMLRSLSCPEKERIWNKHKIIPRTVMVVSAVGCVLGGPVVIPYTSFKFLREIATGSSGVSNIVINMSSIENHNGYDIPYSWIDTGNCAAMLAGYRLNETDTDGYASQLSLQESIASALSFVHFPGNVTAMTLQLMYSVMSACQSMLTNATQCAGNGTKTTFLSDASLIRFPLGNYTAESNITVACSGYQPSLFENQYLPATTIAGYIFCTIGFISIPAFLYFLALVTMTLRVVDDYACSLTAVDNLVHSGKRKEISLAFNEMAFLAGRYKAGANRIEENQKSPMCAMM
ncbi:MAG: hypothetical protein ACD_70C00208G0004 [uncultured bacterium]|nr:MAG: hypothetical protein ACD_70C00208G0004 [uncultured bacterium]OGT26645.1 MAG: hypothetical protein A3B71_03225 [Gammaproteobacteria bacterium RIFCSPHIGHO2_02_FULL_42_43]